MSIHDGVTIIETKRCRLRAFTNDKKTVREIYAFTRDPRVAKFVGWSRHETIKSTYKLAHKVKDRFYKYHDFNHWLIELKETGQVIGFIHLYEEFPGQTLELSYALNAEHWNKGYTKEAVQAVTQYAFETLKAHRLCAKTDPDNVASQHVLRSIGAAIESTIVEYYVEPSLGELRSPYFWRLLAQDYFNAKGTRIDTHT